MSKDCKLFFILISRQLIDFIFQNIISTLKNFAPPCELSCMCNNETFAPICGADGFTYYSACHAGCSGAVSDGGKWNYTECLCIQPPSGLEIIIY